MTSQFEKKYNPPALIFQHLPVEEKGKNIKINRGRNGYIVDVLTSVDIQKGTNLGCEVIKIYEGVFYKFLRYHHSKKL